VTLFNQPEDNMADQIRPRAAKPRARYSNGQWCVFNGTGNNDATMCAVATEFREALYGFSLAKSWARRNNVQRGDKVQINMVNP
jgi:hypothetical protein